MNGSSDSIEETADINSTPTIGGYGYGYGYGLALSLAFLIMFVIITYASYKCKHPQTRDNNNNGISSPNNINNDRHDSTNSDYPRLTYSQLKPLKTDSSASACSICLADYKDTDLIRMLPECGHLFHPTCIGPWLKLHPTCPICRTSPLPSPLWSQLAVTSDRGRAWAAWALAHPN